MNEDQFFGRNRNNVDLTKSQFWRKHATNNDRNKLIKQDFQVSICETQGRQPTFSGSCLANVEIKLVSQIL